MERVHPTILSLVLPHSPFIPVLSTLLDTTLVFGPFYFVFLLVGGETCPATHQSLPSRALSTCRLLLSPTWKLLLSNTLYMTLRDSSSRRKSPGQRKKEDRPYFLTFSDSSVGVVAAILRVFSSLFPEDLPSQPSSITDQATRARSSYCIFCIMETVFFFWKQTETGRKEKESSITLHYKYVFIIREKRSVAAPSNDWNVIHPCEHPSLFHPLLLFLIDRSHCFSLFVSLFLLPSQFSLLNGVGAELQHLLFEVPCLSGFRDIRAPLFESVRCRRNLHIARSLAPFAISPITAMLRTRIDNVSDVVT